MTILHFTNSCPGLLNEGVHSLFIDLMSLILKYPILISHKGIIKIYIMFFIYHHFNCDFFFPSRKKKL